LILALLATLGAIVVAFVLFPIFSTADGDALLDLGPLGRERLDLSEKKNQLLESLQDLDFEKAAGKLSDVDYESARNDYMGQIATLMSRLDEIVPSPPPSRSSSKKGGKKAGTACAGCGESSPPGSKFCLECGKPVERENTNCAKCGETLAAGAKFCGECGEKVVR